MPESPSEWFCGCRALHQMGSGIDVDALDVFAAPVPDGQEELF